MRLLAVRRPGFPRTVVRLRVVVRHRCHANPGCSESGAGHARLCWPCVGAGGGQGPVGVWAGDAGPAPLLAPHRGRRAGFVAPCGRAQRRSQRCCGGCVIWTLHPNHCRQSVIRFDHPHVTNYQNSQSADFSMSLMIHNCTSNDSNWLVNCSALKLRVLKLSSLATAYELDPPTILKNASHRINAVKTLPSPIRPSDPNLNMTT
jgi:hypothetical protein